MVVFLIVLDMYVRGHALLNALRRCSLSLVAAVSRSLVVVMLFVFMSLVGLMVRYSSNISQSVFCQANLSWVVVLFRVNVECYVAVIRVRKT